MYEGGGLRLRLTRPTDYGLKALPEHDIRLNLTLDRYPKGIEEQVIGE
jgi:hypothetical protein